MQILVLDNYDSFTYNLVQYIQELLGHKVDIFRNDAISLDEVDQYDTIILSPGPGVPADAGIMPALIQRYAASKNIFGVCLGQQAIGEAFGGTLRNLDTVFHGVATNIKVVAETEKLFKNIPQNFIAGRYHSWVVEKENFPKKLEITALADNGEIMALRHEKYLVKGVQFHPESVMTEHGMQIIKNFLVEAGHLKETASLQE